MRRRAKVDNNHAEIVSAYRAHGAHVVSLAGVGNGVPDLMICYKGRVHLVEVKQPGQKLRPLQVDFARWWPVRIVTAAIEVPDHLRSFK